MPSPRPLRPAFAAGYGVPATRKGMLDWDWVAERLESTRNYWIASSRPDGSPHAMPVWALWVDGSLIFSTSPDSRKGRNLARDPRVTVAIERDDDVIVLEGTVEEAELAPQIADLYAAKYDYRPQAGDADEGWYRVRPHVAYAWDRDYPRTATRFSFD